MIYHHNTNRGEGRTEAMIKLANETGAYLVVRNLQMVDAIKDKCDRFPITYAEFASSRLRNSFVREVVIDDADALLQYLFSHLNIVGISTGSLFKPTQEGGGDG